MVDVQEPGRVRQLLARWTITARLTLKTAAQIGSHLSDTSDATFARTEDGKPLLPGATMTGALRDALCDRLAGYRVLEKDMSTVVVGSLFGYQHSRRISTGELQLEGHESPLILFDSVALMPAQSTLRDGVRIDPRTGLAQDKLKFDRELSLPGVVFPFRCDLLIVKGTDEAPRCSETLLLTHLIMALEALLDGSVRLGARKSRGLGQIEANCFCAHRYDLTADKGWKEYAESAYSPEPLSHVACQETPEQAITGAWPAFIPSSQDDKRETFTMQFNVAVVDTLLIRSPGRGADDADVVTLTEKDKILLSGTSLAGAFRAQANRILLTLQAPDGMANLIDLFGSEPPMGERGNAGNLLPLKASRIRFMDTEIVGGRTYRQTRTKLDRFTSSTIDTALFEEQPAVEGTAQFTVEVRKPVPADIALLLLLVRDLFDGLMTIGGEASVGRGRLRGTMTATWVEVGQPLLTVDMAADGSMLSSDPVRLNDCLAKLVGSPA